LPLPARRLSFRDGRGPGPSPLGTWGIMEESDDKTSIDFSGFPARLGHLRTEFERVARRVLEDHAVRAYAVSISFVDDAEITALNSERLNRPEPTDVIAFDLSEPGLPFEKVGDIYISRDRALEHSARFSIPLQEELLRLMVHGVLHVLGYRDREPAEAGRMRRVQEKVVKDFQLFADRDEQ
jgi:probable rRNA maturation factor